MERQLGIGWQAISYSYTTQSQIFRLMLPDAADAEYSYDSRGLVSVVRDITDRVTETRLADGTYTVNDSYDDAGRVPKGLMAVV